LRCIVLYYFNAVQKFKNIISWILGMDSSQAAEEKYYPGSLSFRTLQERGNGLCGTPGLREYNFISPAFVIFD